LKLLVDHGAKYAGDLGLLERSFRLKFQDSGLALRPGPD
jgi:hypothetical protein